MMLGELALLRAEGRESLSFDQVVNILGYMPELPELNRYLEAAGLLYVAHGIWKRPETLVAKSGRVPTEQDIRETKGEGASLSTIWPQSGRRLEASQ